MDFDWDDANRSHIAQHGIKPDEAEQVISNRPVDTKVQFRGGEERYLQVGETDAGRILVVVTHLARFQSAGGDCIRRKPENEEFL